LDRYASARVMGQTCSHTSVIPRPPMRMFVQCIDWCNLSSVLVFFKVCLFIWTFCFVFTIIYFHSGLLHRSFIEYFLYDDYIFHSNVLRCLSFSKCQHKQLFFCCWIEFVTWNFYVCNWNKVWIYETCTTLAMTIDFECGD
jgi:hypothetical protein